MGHLVLPVWRPGPAAAHCCCCCCYSGPRQAAAAVQHQRPATGGLRLQPCAGFGRGRPAGRAPCVQRELWLRAAVQKTLPAAGSPPRLEAWPTQSCMPACGATPLSPLTGGWVGAYTSWLSRATSCPAVGLAAGLLSRHSTSSAFTSCSSQTDGGFNNHIRAGGQQSMPARWHNGQAQPLPSQQAARKPTWGTAQRQTAAAVQHWAKRGAAVQGRDRAHLAALVWYVRRAQLATVRPLPGDDLPENHSKSAARIGEAPHSSLAPWAGWARHSCAAHSSLTFNDHARQGRAKQEAAHSRGIAYE